MLDVVIGVGLLSVLAVAAWLSAIDLREHRLPNRLVGSLAAAVAAWLLLAGLLDGDLARFAQAIGWGCLAVAVFFVLHLAGGLGMGDVKFVWPLAAALGWFGWDSLGTALLGLALAGGTAVIWKLVRYRTMKMRLAYGPIMSIGFACGALQALS